jgi:hypothetical protein
MSAIKGRGLEPKNRSHTEMLGNEHTPSMASQHRLGHFTPEWLQTVAGGAQQPCVSIVLRQAQNLWGKRYAEIIAAVPPELLAQWDAQLNQEEGRV